MKIFTVDDLAKKASKKKSAKYRVLLLADTSHPANAVQDHISEIRKNSRNDVFVVNPIKSHKTWALYKDKFDAVIIHYSVCTLFEYYFPPNIEKFIKDFNGLKIQIIQDEMRWIDRMIDRICELGIDVLYSSLSSENIFKVYDNPKLSEVTFISCLPGYISSRLMRFMAPKVEKRPYHIVYRGRALPIWLGKFSQEKANIAEHAIEMSHQYELNIDCKAAENDRLYGKKWEKFLSSGKATLATEGGATVFDFDESIEKNVREYYSHYPNSSVDEVWKKFVEPFDGIISHKTITPRVFEAIFTKTALIMFPGEFRGILKPWEHYIPLERDGSNHADIALYLKDDGKISELVNRTYNYVSRRSDLRFSFYVSSIDQIIDEVCVKQLNSRKKYRKTIFFKRNFVNKIDERISAFSRPHSFEFRTINRVKTSKYYIWIDQKVKNINYLMDNNSKKITNVSSIVYAGNDYDFNQNNIALICDLSFSNIGTVRDHLCSFKKYSKNNVFIFDSKSLNLKFFNINLFDAVVLHYSLIISSRECLAEKIKNRIKIFSGPKIVFIQDEYRWVNRTAASIKELGIDTIYSVVNEDAIDRVYCHPDLKGVKKNVTLTGFVPEELLQLDLPDYENRKIDVGYRARKVPAWLGSFAQEKWHIGQRFLADALKYNLKCDIEHSESKRLYGEAWISFVSNCKAVLGTESGASFVDFDGTVQPKVDMFEAENPDVDFDEIRSRFLKNDGDIVIRVISPRIFEAAALKTLMILYPGDYSGALVPWRHYVPLQRDHGNMEEVVAVLNDKVRATEIIENAYKDVALNPRFSYKQFIEEFDDEIASRMMGDVVCDIKKINKLSKIETKTLQAYTKIRLPKVIIRGVVYKLSHWGIDTFVPAAHRHAVRNLMKNIAKYLKSILVK